MKRVTIGLPPSILDKGKPVARPGRKAKGQLLRRLAAWPPKGCWFQRPRKRPLVEQALPMR